MIYLSQNKKEIFWITFLYVIAYGLLLLNKGHFWDDWILVDVDPKEVLDVFRQAGTPWAWSGHYHNLLLGLSHNILAYRLLTFFTFLISGYFFYSILLSIKEVDSRARFILTLFFVLIPVNSARIALINTPYALTYFTYFFAFYLISRSDFRSNLLLKTLTFLLLMFSFNTASLLVFYFGTILLFLFYKNFHKDSNLPKSQFIINFIKLNWWLILAPFIFYISKSYFWKPYGIYEGYNQINLSLLIRPMTQFPNSMLEISGFSLSTVTVVLIALVIISLRLKKIRPSNMLRNILGLISGILLCWLALFPYLLIGLNPDHTGWNSRNQLLVPLGLSFILFFVIELIADSFPKHAFLRFYLTTIIISFFIIKNVDKQIDFERDYLAQTNLINLFAHDPLFKSGDNFILHNEVKTWANNRSLSFYEFSGMSRKALGDQSRWASNSAEQKYKKNKLFIHEKYNLKDFKGKSHVIELRIINGPASDALMGRMGVLKLMLIDQFDSDSFKTSMENYLLIKPTIYSRKVVPES